MLVPAGVSTVWFSIFGGTAIVFEQDSKSIWGEGSAQEQLFALLHSLPGGQIAGIIAMVLLGTFFITSADSASTVMGTMSQRGSLEPVSYTHLDVYKRQEDPLSSRLIAEGAAMRIGLAAGLGFAAWRPQIIGGLLPVVATMWTFSTVSYTHQDVYKNQRSGFRSVMPPVLN